MEIALIVIGAVLILLLALWIFAIAPGRSKTVRAYTSARYAHRGLHSEGVAENSITAFRLAVERGFGIELDVRLSKDKQLVVFHDDTLDRVCGVSGRVDAFTAEELGKMSLPGTEDGIPLFDEVLDLVSGRVPLLVEIKEDAGNSEVSRLASERLSTYTGDYIVESFNPLSLRTVRERLPHVDRGILSHRYLAYKPYRKPLYFLLQCLLLNLLCRPTFVAYDYRHFRNPSFFILTRIFRTAAFAWTVRSKEDEAAARRHGFDSVIFAGYLPED